jgi:hypothetical protein
MYAAILKDMREVVPNLKSSNKKIRSAAWKKVQNRCLGEYNKDVLRLHDKEKAKEEYVKNIRKMAELYPASRDADKDDARVP